MKRQTTHWEKIFLNFVSDKRINDSIYPPKLNEKRNNPIKWVNCLDRYSVKKDKCTGSKYIKKTAPQKTHGIGNKHRKSHPMSLAIREMKI